MKRLSMLLLFYTQHLAAAPGAVFYTLIAASSCGSICYCFYNFCQKSCSLCLQECVTCCNTHVKACKTSHFCCASKTRKHTSQDSSAQLLISGNESDSSTSSQDTVIIHNSPPPSPERPHSLAQWLCCLPLQK